MQHHVFSEKGRLQSQWLELSASWSILTLAGGVQRDDVSSGKHTTWCWQPYLSWTHFWINGRRVHSSFRRFDKTVEKIYSVYRLCFLEGALPFSICQREGSKLILQGPSKVLMPNPWCVVHAVAYMAMFVTDLCCPLQCSPFLTFQF